MALHEVGENRFAVVNDDAIRALNGIGNSAGSGVLPWQHSAGATGPGRVVLSARPEPLQCF